MKKIISNFSRFVFPAFGWLFLIQVWFFSAHTFSQTLDSEELTVNGKVISEDDGMPLTGVSVIVKNSSTGTVTDFDGNYVITAPEDGTLVFSYLGFVTEEAPVNSQSTINVSLATDAQSLEEVAVTGYSTQRIQDITGSVSVVDTETLQSVPANSAAQALQGQASGVNVINSGVPGANSRILIRGITSFGDSGPLVIVDGVPSELNNINANTIESIQVLKDAGAAAIYGVRGANGVIVVTTKKGKIGKPIFSYDAYYGLQTPLSGNPFNLTNTTDFAQLHQIAYPNSVLFENGIPDYLYVSPQGTGTAMSGDPAIDPSNYSFDPQNLQSNYLIQEVNKEGTNWFQELFSSALRTNHNFTASGGTDSAKYLFSLEYLNEQGTLLETYLKRYSARVNTSYEFNKNIRVGQNLNLSYRDRPNYGDLSFIIQATHVLMPIIPVYDIGGNFGGTRIGPDLGGTRNPVGMQKRASQTDNNSWDVVGNAYAEVDFLQKFRVRTSLGGSLNFSYNHNMFIPDYENVQEMNRPNQFNESAGYANQLVWTNTLTYEELFGRHNLDILVGTEAIRNSGRGVGGSRQGYFVTDPDYLTLNNGTENVTNYSNVYETSLFSIFSRLDYSFDDKYLLGATLRRDGSSRFGADTRYGVFPSISAGWRLGQEAFMENLNWLDDLKLRGSYGILGSQNNINPENAFNLYGGGYGNAYYDITGSSNSIRQGFIRTRIGNFNTGWEENIVTNLGIDVVLFDYSLDVSVEYYKKAIEGLLFSQSLLATAGGATPPTVNVGDIQNTGFDLSATFHSSLSENWNFSIGSNLTTYKNLVVDIPDPGHFDAAGNQILGNLVRNQEGQAVSSFFGYDVVGLFRSEEDVASSPSQTDAAPGRFKYRDVDGDGEITPDDRTFIGDPNPDFTLGLNIGLDYKSFDLSAIFYGSYGGDIVNTVTAWTHFFNFPGAKSNVLLDAWSPDNPDSNIPKIEATNSFSTSGTLNSYFVEDGSYFRMRSLTLGYTLEESIAQSIGLSRFRLYLQGTNLFTITDYSGLDPEIGGSVASFGIDNGTYPNNEKSYLIGLNLTF